jgi:hypothetical protein
MKKRLQYDRFDLNETISEVIEMVRSAIERMAS